MATKVNANLSIDRESIGLLADYSVTLTKTLEEIRADIANSAKYLLSEDNLSGAEVEKFQEAVKIVDTTSAAALAKMEKFQKAISQIGQKYAGDAAKAGRNLEAIREQLGAVKAKLEATR